MAQEGSRRIMASYLRDDIYKFLPNPVLQHGIAMAQALSPSSSVPFLFVLLGFCNREAYGDNEGFDVARVETLIPATVCSESTVPSGNSLQVVHRFGPCFPSSDGPPDDDQILGHDSLRPAYLKDQIRLANATGNKRLDDLRASELVTFRMGDLGNGVYVVTIRIGTPKRPQTVVFDTGSNVCWLQCRPCPTCYTQREPIFDPFTSSTYHNVTCNAQACTLLPPHDRSCTNNTCTYRVFYADSSSSAGFLGTERLELTSSYTFSNFVFGCGQTNHAKFNFKGAAGMIGLGRTFHSLVTQTVGKDDGVFSYCLPSLSSTRGYLTLGRRAAPSPSYTSMLPGPGEQPSLYFVDLIGISVASRQLPLSPSVFRSVGTVIDSGTMISRLPPAAYAELRATFRSAMSRYRLVAQIGILDTCYNTGGIDFVHPQVTLHFSGGTDLRLSASQLFYTSSPSVHCLAFAVSNTSGGLGIIGSVQQQGIEVIYDIHAQRIGFSAGTNCH